MDRSRPSAQRRPVKHMLKQDAAERLREAFIDFVSGSTRPGSGSHRNRPAVKRSIGLSARLIPSAGYASLAAAG